MVEWWSEQDAVRKSISINQLSIITGNKKNQSSKIDNRHTNRYRENEINQFQTNDVTNQSNISFGFVEFLSYTEFFSHISVIFSRTCMNSCTCLSISPTLSWFPCFSMFFLCLELVVEWQSTADEDNNRKFSTIECFQWVVVDLSNYYWLTGVEKKVWFSFYVLYHYTLLDHFETWNVLLLRECKQVFWKKRKQYNSWARNFTQLGFSLSLSISCLVRFHSIRHFWLSLATSWHKDRTVELDDLLNLFSSVNVEVKKIRTFDHEWNYFSR